MVDLRCKGSVHDVVFDASLQKDTIQGISEDTQLFIKRLYLNFPPI